MKTHDKSHNFQCGICKYVSKSRNELENHMKTHDKGHIFPCVKCKSVYKTNSELETHMKSHNDGPNDMSELQRAADSIEDGLKCNTCNKQCKDMNEIRRHRKAEHPSYKPCKNFPGQSAEDRCKFGDQCDWNHVELREGECICWTCGLIFTNNSDLTFHRKNVHKSTGPCKYFGLPGGCNKEDKDCQFMHAKGETRQPHVTKTQGFRQVQQNTAPPIMRTERESALVMLKEYMMHQQEMAQQFIMKLSQ